MRVSGDQPHAGVTRPSAPKPPRGHVAPQMLDSSGREEARSRPGAQIVQRLQAQLEKSQADLRSTAEQLNRTRQELERRKQAETALQTTEDRLRLVMRAANIGFWDWHIPTNLVYHSPEWKRQLGYEDHEITNAIDEWQTRLHPDDKD